MTEVILNIGLWDSVDEAEITHYAAAKALRDEGFVTYSAIVLDSDTERTLVVEGNAPSDFAIYNVASRLNQDCIAVWDQYHWEGRLVGPRSAGWGEFEPSKFFLLNGSRLSEARSVA